ncbi:related to capsule polysaccharide biosynthesis protein [Rhynchosporium secalis]|uniref:Related to capsule polysaccharide biosynthesis protein n=1 Tax=Rhynchosporium secalis TaxID=38038 RepID=A0A1E1MJ61_RHYSE|nr:related to capsule polysaccharide biosynthesis protein [Rhynchosporium secalis]
MTYVVNPGNVDFPPPDGCVPRSSEPDARSDSEILDSLTSHIPTTDSEKNIWAYWHTGFESMPPWTKRNVISWCRLQGPSWTIRVLDNVPGSPNNLLNFVPIDFFPPAFKSGKMAGPYVATHSADLVRLPLLQLYGGIWLDVGIILIRELNSMWNVLCDPTNKFEFAALTFTCRPDEEVVINGFFMARANNELAERWHKTYLAVWGDATECTGFSEHALLKHIPIFGTPTKEMNAPEIKVSQRGIMDYGAHVLCFERLRDLVDVDDGWNGREYFENKMFLLKGLDEMWRYQTTTAFSGQVQFEKLCTKLDGSSAQGEDATKAKEAKMWIDDLLANTTMLKFCHGPKGAIESALADLYDDPKNADRDCEPGTAAVYLRRGILEFDQTRELKPLQIEKPKAKVWNVGFLDPFV